MIGYTHQSKQNDPVVKREPVNDISADVEACCNDDDSDGGKHPGHRDKRWPKGFGRVSTRHEVAGTNNTQRREKTNRLKLEDLEFEQSAR